MSQTLELKILQANCYNFQVNGTQAKDIEESSKIIQLEKPDIVVLEEINKPQANYLSLHTGLNNLEYQRNFKFSSTESGNAIMSKYKLKSAPLYFGTHEFFIATLFGGLDHNIKRMMDYIWSRGERGSGMYLFLHHLGESVAQLAGRKKFTHATIEAYDKEIDIIFTHLNSSSPRKRNYQGKRLVKYIQKLHQKKGAKNLFLIGDLNSVHEYAKKDGFPDAYNDDYRKDTVIPMIRRLGIFDIDNAMVYVDGKPQINPKLFTYEASGKYDADRMIDHIFPKKGIKELDLKTIKLPGTDHLALVGTYLLNK